MTSTNGSGEFVLFEEQDGVGVVTLNRPDRLNAINWEMATRLIELFREIRQRDEVRSIVLTGAGGRAFCAGGDVEWLSGSTDRPIPGLSDLPVPRFQRKTPGGPFAEFIRTMIEVDKPVIAAISGVAVGAGLSMALACDRRFADAKSRFSAIFVKRGLGADIGITWFLPRIVGLSRALQMVETGMMLDAATAKEFGIVDELVDEGGALDAAMDYARELARGASVAIDINRRLVYKSLTSTLEEMLDYDAIAATLTAMTADAKEGTTAFMEKREAQFKGV
jgi:2-(1,2-epoxy-1,2-dihydrophenyl)acetyl-CoA isomerase